MPRLPRLRSQLRLAVPVALFLSLNIKGHQTAIACSGKAMALFPSLCLMSITLGAATILPPLLFAAIGYLLGWPQSNPVPQALNWDWTSVPTNLQAFSPLQSSIPLSPKNYSYII